MIEAVMIWNEPNNKSHWDFEIDPEWRMFSKMAIAAADAVAETNPQLLRVFGGISPIDPKFIERMKNFGALDHFDVVALHGFPLDWNHWPINEWPQRVREIEDVTELSAPRIIDIFIWDYSARMGRPSSRCDIFPNTLPLSASVSGFILKIIGSIKQCSGCGDSA